MNSDRVCGNCVFGGDAYDRYGNLDGQYVICQIKEAENRQRKPDRFNTTSAVSRMHVGREACLHWKSSEGEAPLPMQQPVAASSGGDSIYDQMYASFGGGSSALDEAASYGGYSVGASEWQPPIQAPAAQKQAAPLYKDTHVATAENEAEIKRLKTQLMQKEQMVMALQNQNVYMAEETSRLKEELDKAQRKLEQLKPFDVALFAEVNYFSLLGVKETATPEQIKEAYRARMKLLHPDRFINISQRLNQAYETLMDAEKRRKYLAQIQPAKGKF